MVPEKLKWLDEEGKGGRDAPSGKGSRFIVSHVGSRACALLPGALYCVAVNYNKESEDYHNSMNGEVFMEWLPSSSSQRCFCGRSGYLSSHLYRRHEAGMEEDEES